MSSYVDGLIQAEQLIKKVYREELSEGTLEMTRQELDYFCEQVFAKINEEINRELLAYQKSIGLD